MSQRRRGLGGGALGNSYYFVALGAAWRKEAELLKGNGDQFYRKALEKYVELVPADAKARKELNK